jgi:hypothetical protein
MKHKILAVPAWVEDERSLLHYLMSPHEGHHYAEDVIDGISLITSWILVSVAVLSVVGVLADAWIR